MTEYFINVTLKETPPTPGPWKRTRHEFHFCAESERDARYLASKNVPSKGWSYDEVIIEIMWTRRVYVPETSLLFGPVPQSAVMVVKFEGAALVSCRDLGIEQTECGAASNDYR